MIRKHITSSSILFSIIILTLALLQTPLYPQAAEKPKEAKDKKGLPLKPSRKVKFTTDEGTWMSLDVSPDGKTIVFDLLGDLYRLPFGGGKAVRITSGLAFDAQPRFSPDGRMIAFVSDRSGSNNLWIANADGTEPKQLSKDKQAEYISPVWTPDGDYVIVSKSTPASLGSAELWMFHKLGGSGLKISKGGRPAAPRGGRPRPGPSSYGPQISRDGRHIFYTRMAPRTGPRIAVPRGQIIRRNIRNGDEDPITFNPGGAFRPVISPDSAKIVFGTRYEGKTGLRIRNLLNGDEKWLKFPVQRDELESRPTRDHLPGYAFTPDGSSVVVSFGGKIHTIDILDGTDTVIPFSADVELDAGPSLYVRKRLDEGPVRARLIQEPAVSPDGRMIAFSALGGLYTLRRDGGSPVRLTSNEHPREFQPSFSPDGVWISFVTWSTKGGHIWKQRTDGTGTPVRLTTVPAFYRDPVWSPDGSLVFALRATRLIRVNHPSDFLAPQPGLDIIKLPADGGLARMVVPSRGLGKPHFGPERDRVYVYGTAGLVSYRFDGTDRRTHLKVVGKSRRGRPAPALDVRISPDGKMALALLTGQLYVMAVPRAGGDPPTLSVVKASVPTRKLTKIGADSFSWADRGKTITWIVGSTFYTQGLSTVDFKPPEKPKKDAKAKEGKSAEEPKAKNGERPSPAVEREIVVEMPRHTPKGAIALRGARVITMKGDEVIDRADIVIVNNRIKAIGKQGSLTIPTEARVFDVRGKTIIPGLIDIHAHWEVRHQVLDTEDYTFWSNLAYGVTTGRDPQTNTNDTFAYQDLVDMGEMVGPRIFTTGPGIFSDTDFQSLEEARDTISRYKKHYRTETLKSYLVGNRQQRQWVVEASRQLGIIPTTEGGSNFKMDLTHAIDGFAGNEHALPIVPLYKDVIQLFAQTGITYTPTLVVAYGGPQGKYYFFEHTEVYGDPKLKRFNPQAVLDGKTARLPWFRESEYIFPEIAKYAAAIVNAGGRVGLGGHGELQGLQCHWEMWALGMGGMKNHDILRVGTIFSAEAIGYGDDLGSLEAGKMADLVILDRDPLEDIKNTNTIRYVMKNGELYEGDTLEMIWPEKRSLPVPWWAANLP